LGEQSNERKEPQPPIYALRGSFFAAQAADASAEVVVALRVAMRDVNERAKKSTTRSAGGAEGGSFVAPGHWQAGRLRAVNFPSGTSWDIGDRFGTLVGTMVDENALRSLRSFARIMENQSPTTGFGSRRGSWGQNVPKNVPTGFGTWKVGGS
jgi:hypothetical protein